MRQNFTIFDTPLGCMAIAWTDKGISRLVLSEETEAKTIAQLKKHVPDAIQAEPTTIVQRTIKLIQMHLEGTSQEFSRRVYEAAREVLAGQVATYGDIARVIGSPTAARAVGRALGANPVSIIVPCHRIIGKSGNMTGFSAYGGCNTKIRLLSIERALSSDKISTSLS